MKEIPILFSTPMVQAILAGRKTQTRRIVKSRSAMFGVATAKYEPDALGYYHNRSIEEVDEDERSTGKTIFCPYGKTEKGSILWVRESFCHYQTDTGFEIPHTYTFKTDKNVTGEEKWKPSIHMPKTAARIWLEVTDIRVEKLQDISEDDSIAEGVQENLCDNPAECLSSFKKDHVCCGKGEYFRYGKPMDFEAEPCYSAKESFRTLWESINGLESWNVNPWVWAVSFKVLSTTGKATQLSTDSMTTKK